MAKEHDTEGVELRTYQHRPWSRELLQDRGRPLLPLEGNHYAWNHYAQNHYALES